jgi:ATP-dependent phosphofructokinase / diphosphate-dependent phosphofructokinase
MVCMKHGQFIPIPFSSMVDPVSGRTRVRLVDTESYAYTIARRYMVRLCEDDFDNDQVVAQYAATVGMTSAAFRERFKKSSGPTAPRRGEHRPAAGRTGIG